MDDLLLHSLIGIYPTPAWVYTIQVSSLSLSFSVFACLCIQSEQVHVTRMKWRWFVKGEIGTICSSSHYWEMWRHSSVWCETPLMSMVAARANFAWVTRVSVQCHRVTHLAEWGTTTSTSRTTVTATITVAAVVETAAYHSTWPDLHLFTLSWYFFLSPPVMLFFSLAKQLQVNFSPGKFTQVKKRDVFSCWTSSCWLDIYP